MKFLCPSCKAKYQIADEKVAGRSVRMKCRKCGYLISIGKAVTDGSVSRKLSSMPPPPDSEPGVQQPPPRAAATGWREPGSRTSNPGPTPRPPARPVRPGAGPVAPPRASSAGAGMQAVAPAAPTHSPKNGNGSSAHHHAFRVEAPPVHRDVDEDRTVIAGAGALSHAFAESVTGPESSALAASLAATDEWYVGINGVPVGPIRLSELRSKAASGSISSESLVWREGFEQWLPLSNFPELVAIVEEGFSSARASLTPLSPPSAREAAPPAAPRPQVYDPFALPGGGTPVVAHDPFQEMLRPSQPVPDAFGQPATQQTPLGLVASPYAQRPPVESEEIVLAKPRSGSAAFAWVAVGIALMLGLTIGFVMFSKKPPEPVVKYVEVPAKAGETPGAQPATGAGAAAGETEIEIDAGGGKTVKVAAGQAGKPPAPGEKPEEKPLTGLSGLQGLQGGGPTSGPVGGGSGTTGGAGGKPLDSGEIQKTVGKYTSSVKRSCWQPALDARSKDAPTSARVNVAIVVSPSGSVQSVSTSGDPKGYPGLASCIAARVKGWQFPPSSGTTTVNVPFVFASQ